jgi:hypothetical protein
MAGNKSVDLIRKSVIMAQIQPYLSCHALKTRGVVFGIAGPRIDQGSDKGRFGYFIFKKEVQKVTKNGPISKALCIPMTWQSFE